MRGFKPREFKISLKYVSMETVERNWNELAKKKQLAKLPENQDFAKQKCPRKLSLLQYLAPTGIYCNDCQAPNAHVEINQEIYLIISLIVSVFVVKFAYAFVICLVRLQ